MSEALKCFTYLAENVPLWVKGLEELELKVKHRHNEIARVPVPVSQNLKRTGSNESIRPGHENGSKISAGFMSAPQAEDFANAQTNEQMVLAKRKRKTTSLLSNTSGAHKYRSRSTIIVYYDSEVQEAFEQLVRNIGIGRNHIRKARMAARMEALTSNDDGDMDSGFPIRNTRVGVNVGATDACVMADKALDKAQALCEKGAHQFLRDGDCAEETARAKESFEKVIETSRKEAERLKVVEQERERVRVGERQKERERQERGREEVDIHPALLQQPNGLIEADDDDESEDDGFDDPASLPRPPFRLMART